MTLHEPVQASLRRAIGLLCLLAGAVALLALAGHGLGHTGLAALGQGLWPLPPLGALLWLLLSGAVMLSTYMSARPGACRLALLLALGAALVLILAWVGASVGSVWHALRLPPTQRLSPATTLAGLGSLLAILLRWGRPDAAWRNRQAGALFALVPLVLGMVVLIGYAAGVPLLYVAQRIPMSLPSGLAATCVGAALSLAMGKEVWPLALFAGSPEPGTGADLLPSVRRPMAVLLVSTALLLVGVNLVLKRQFLEAREQAQTQLRVIADLKAAQISRWYGERLGNAERLAHGELVANQLRRYLARPDEALREGEVRTWMEQLQRGTYAAVVLFDAQGRIRLTAPADGRFTPGSYDQTELQQALHAKDERVSDLHRDAGQRDSHLCLWIPLGAGRLADGCAEGVLLLVLDPHQFLYPLLQSWPTPSASAETTLVRRDGDAVLFLSELRHRAGAALDLRIPLGQDPNLPAAQAVLGQAGVVASRDYRQVPVLAAFGPVPGTPWSMVAKVDEAEIYGPIRQRVWALGIGLFVLLSLAALGIGLVVRQRELASTRAQLVLSRRYEWMLREANDIILLLDAEGRILEANAQAAAHYGYTEAELRGMRVVDLRAPGTQGEWEELFDKVLRLGSLRFESLHVRRDGSTFPVEVSAGTLQIGDRLYVNSFVRDITERRTHERDLQRMTQLYSALSQVNQAIVWSPTQPALLAKICEVLVEFGRFDMAWIGWNDPLTHQVSVAASHGDCHGYLDRIRVESGDSILAQGPVGTAIREACPCVINDFLTAAGTKPWREAAAAAGFGSTAAFPIRRGGEVVGALAVYAGEADFFGTHEAALLIEAAMDISFAMDHLAGETRRQEAEAALIESEQQLREAQEAGGIGTYTWNIAEDRWKSSAQLDRIFGIDATHPRNLAGWIAVVAPHFREQLQAYVAGIMSRHEPFDLDYPIVRLADQAPRWVHGQGTLSWDAEGNPLALKGVIQDITDRKRAEAQYQKASVVLEQSPLAVLITDLRGTIEYVNPAFTAITGYSAEEAIGQNPRLLKSPSALPEQYRQLWETLTRGEVWVGIFENRRKDGVLFQERATIAPIRDRAGAITGYVGMKEDTTRLKKDREERRSLEAQLQQSQKLESLGSLAGGVAHDMNNVLGAILGLASTLREQADPATASARNLDTIVSACMRGRGVVKGLLYFAQKDLQEEQLIDLNGLIEELKQLLGHSMRQRIQLGLDLQKGLGLVRADGGALSHAIMNLCVNAMDAMPAGGVMHLQTSTSAEGGLELRVRDTGEGMAPEVLAKAMEPFFTTKPQGKGTGLGLAMVYGTMKAHDGRFELLSQPGHGTEAILHFPASRVVPRASTPGEVTAATPVPTSALRILMVDDDELIRESVAPMLEMLGHTVATAASGLHALRLLESPLPVDLVILDMNMPGMGGAEVLPRILELRPGMPVILSTGYSDHEIAPLLAEYPGVSGLRKPFSMKEIKERIAAQGLRPMAGQDAHVPGAS